MTGQQKWQELVIVLSYNLREQADLSVTKLPTALNALLNSTVVLGLAKRSVLCKLWPVVQPGHLKVHGVFSMKSECICPGFLIA